MAHAYSSNPLYGGTPSYTPQQPYYPPFPPNGLQQQVQTPPSLPQQPPQPPSYQPSPTGNAPRFDTNSQIRPPAPPFPHFPQPPAAFNPDLFKQFATAGLPPPPPPPSFPPVPLPTTGYPQFASSVSSAAPSPYGHHGNSGAQGVGTGYGQLDLTQQHLGDYFGGSQHGPGESRESRKSRHGPQSYSASIGGLDGSSHSAHGRKTVDDDIDKELPSFGSRSDLDLLFATVQSHTDQTEVGSAGHSASAMTQVPVDEGNVSPYDPSRPATIPDRGFGGFGTSGSVTKTVAPKPVVRTYDNKSPAELRQLAKGALLSLVPHNILYKDLVQEGVDPQVLRDLYGELGIKVDTERPKSPRQIDTSTSDPSTTEAVSISQKGGVNAASEIAPVNDLSKSAVAATQATLPVSGLNSVQQNQAVQSPAASSAKSTQPAPSPNLERKDRIAQLLAAKTGRASSASSTAIEESPKTTAGSNAVVSAEAASPSEPLTGHQQVQSLPKAKAQTEVVKQRMEQLRREAQAKADAAVKDTSDSVDADLHTGAGPTFTIPGLFMTSSGSIGFDEASDEPAAVDVIETTTTLVAKDTAGENAATESNDPQSSNTTLKRPLAVDFDEPSTQPQAKRVNLDGNLPPSATQDNVDDESHSEGEIVEGAENDQVEDEPGSVPQNQHDGNRPSGELPVSEKPPLAKPDMSLPALTALQDATANSTGEISGGESYHAKQSQIEAMRRKIAELEQRNKLKRSKSQLDTPVSSNPATPAMNAEAPQPSGLVTSQPSALAGCSATSQTMNRQPLTRPTISKLTPAQLAERAAALKADLLRQRAQRQQVLQEGLPDLNVEVQNTEARLEKARNDLARARTEVEAHQAALERSIKRVKELSEEIAELEKQLKEGRSGQKQYSDELQQIKLEKLAEAQEAQDAPAPPPTSTSPPVTGQGASDIQNHHDKDHHLSAPTQSSAPGVTFDDSRIVQSRTSATSDDLSQKTKETLPQSPVTSDRAGAEEVLEETTRVDTLQTDAMDISPEPEYLPETETPATVSDSRQTSDDMSMDVDDNSEGSVSMSDSGSEGEEEEEDYEPADVDTTQPMQSLDEDSDEYDPEEAPVEDLTPATGVEQEDVDVYEPSEHVEETEADESADQRDKSADQAQVVSVVSPETKVDDAESGPQLTEADTLNKPQDAPDSEPAQAAPVPDDGQVPSATRFVPYQTPLSTFKKFRFHRSYTDTVKTGYRSLTYSNQIDPSRPFCPTELSGEPCTDPKCEEQHFGQLGLPDEKILVQMSSAMDIEDATERNEFIVGLKHVIADLKSRGVKEFEEVADALSAYRRQFFAAKDREDSP
ncbi:hypothetical protein KCU88_g4683, partial [Aureobasidium melanogenum]